MANIKIYKIRSLYFALARTASDILIFQICYLQKLGQGLEISLSRGKTITKRLTSVNQLKNETVE